VLSSLPEFLDRFPATRISLLHLDLDVLEPTEFALDRFYSRIVPGGLIVIDDYNAEVGATLAVDRFMAGKGLSLQKLPYYSAPSYARKPG
jgi:Macrocin-O-methyltransferase (TylF)